MVNNKEGHTDVQETENKTSESSGGFLQNLIASIFSSHSPEAVKKRQLKNIAKDFSKTKFHGFYKPSSGEITPTFAKLFYDIYKIIYPAQNYIRGIQNPNQFKSQVINFALTEQQSSILEQLSEDNIIEKSKQIPIKELKNLVNTSLEKFTNDFDGPRSLKTESLYRAYMSFIEFCSFDYYFMLKKFTKGLQEGSFNGTPAFERTNAEYLLDDIQDFITIIYSIPDEINWDPLFAMIKAIRGGDLVSPGTWKKIIARMKALQASQALDMMVRLIMKNPAYAPKYTVHNETIVDHFVDKTRDDILGIMNKLENDQKMSKEKDFCLQIFGKTTIDLLNNYTRANSSILEKKELNYYEHTDALNYLKEFLLEHVKKDLREYSDIVVVRGQWDAKISAPFSNSYQDLLAISEQIKELDDTLSDDGSSGMKIRTLLPKISHDAGAENIVNRLVMDANDTARNLITKSTQDLITIGKLMKQLIEDEKLKKPILVQNWPDLERYSEKPLLQFGIDLYKRIYLFVQLMQTCLADAE